MARRGVLTVLAVCVLLAAGCAGEDPGAVGEPPSDVSQPSAEEPDTSTEPAEEPEPARRGVRLVEVVDGLDSPVYVTAAPGEPERLYVVERDGLVRVLEGGRVLRDPFLDVTGEVVSGGEQGLLSVAFHPGYAENGLLYLNFTDRNGDTNVVEYRARPGGAPEKRRLLLLVDQPYGNHNGGQLQFGPDGLLYVGMGDGGSGGDPENRAQNLDSQLGKLLRLDVTRPEAGWEIAAYGLRNPWRFSFDRVSGDLWIGDVGQGAWEEIDLLPAGSRGLVNFGWDAREGSRVFEDKAPNGAGRLVDPVAEYSHDEGCSVTGGYVYRGEDVPDLAGRYLYGDFCSGAVWSLGPGDGARPKRLPFEVGSLSSFGEDARGELHLVSLDGTIFRLDSRT